MYIKSVEITNIRSIDYLEMQFAQPAGWHVLIGDNGSGKSNVVRSIAAALVGPDQIGAVLPIWNDWLKYDAAEGSIILELSRDKDKDGVSPTRPPVRQSIKNEFKFQRKQDKVLFSSNANVSKMNPSNYNWGNNGGWFSVAYGPFRRFAGGDDKWNKVYYSAPKAGAHLSVFGEDIALTEPLEWLKELDRRSLKEKSTSPENSAKETTIKSMSESGRTFLYLKKFINETGVLPHGSYFEKIDTDGELVFIDGNNHPIKVIQMSDGYRSILSLTFELIRQLILVYGASNVFKWQPLFKIEGNFALNTEIREQFRERGRVLTPQAQIKKMDSLGSKWEIADNATGKEYLIEQDGQELNVYEWGKMSIDLPGVVLVDEIDAHLHPTWQTRIGQWFTSYFPQLQFIVTTHSPLICRACEQGSIWRLSPPGSQLKSGEVTGIEKNRLIFGNILDAYGTEVFGQNVSISDSSNKKMDRMAELNIKSIRGRLSETERTELKALEQIFPTGIIK